MNYYSFHILDSEWGHTTIEISGHPRFPAQVILNSHEYVTSQARKAAISSRYKGGQLFYSYIVSRLLRRPFDPFREAGDTIPGLSRATGAAARFDRLRRVAASENGVVLWSVPSA